MSAVLSKEDFVVTDDRRLLKIKIKHLAEEAKIIRTEEQKVHGMAKWKLQHHRKTTVRDAARRTQFAYAIIRGKTLESTAGGYALHWLQGDDLPVLKMVKKYGSPEQQQDAKAIVKRWFK